MACTTSPHLALEVIENRWDGSVLAESRVSCSESPSVGHRCALYSRPVPCTPPEVRNPEFQEILVTTDDSVTFNNPGIATD